MSLTATVKARLTAAGLAAFDGPPTRLPTGPYVVLTDWTPTRHGHRPGGNPTWERATISVACHARSRVNARAALAAVIDELVGWRPYSDTRTGPFRVLDGSLPMQSGPPNEVWHTFAAVFRCSVAPGATLT